MNPYEEFQSMVTAKQETVMKFIIAFQDKLRERLGTTKAYCPQEDSGIIDGNLETQLVIMFHGDTNIRTLYYKFDMTVKPISKNKIIMVIDRKRIEIDFNHECITESFTSALEQTEQLIRNKIDFTL